MYRASNGNGSLLHVDCWQSLVEDLARPVLVAFAVIMLTIMGLTFFIPVSFLPELRILLYAFLCELLSTNSPTSKETLSVCFRWSYICDELHCYHTHSLSICWNIQRYARTCYQQSRMLINVDFRSCVMTDFN